MMMMMQVQDTATGNILGQICGGQNATGRSFSSAGRQLTVRLYSTTTQNNTNFFRAKWNPGKVAF